VGTSIIRMAPGGACRIYVGGYWVTGPRALCAQGVFAFLAGLLLDGICESWDELVW
jgi:hypothetical protein